MKTNCLWMNLITIYKFWITTCMLSAISQNLSSRLWLQWHWRLCYWCVLQQNLNTTVQNATVTTGSCPDGNCSSLLSVPSCHSASTVAYQAQWKVGSQVDNTPLPLCPVTQTLCPTAIGRWYERACNVCMLAAHGLGRVWSDIQLLRRHELNESPA